VTSLCSCDSGSTKNLLLAAYADGTAVLWHASSRRRLVERQTEDQLYAAALSGSMMALAGHSGRIYVSPVEKKQFTILPDEHRNRVFKLHFDEKEPRLLYSGGWDCLVVCWDTLTLRKLWSTYGITTAGNALDTFEERLLAGNDADSRRVMVLDKFTG
jgi:WD40 repeat protein